MKILILSPPSLHKTQHFGGTGVEETRYTKTMVPCQVPLTLPAEIMSGTRKGLRFRENSYICGDWASEVGDCLVVRHKQPRVGSLQNVQGTGSDVGVD